MSCQSSVIYEYRIESHGGREFLFLNWSDGSNKKNCYVFEKASDQAYSKDAIRIYDDVELPFIRDSAVVGNWYSYDFVRTIEEFDPEHRSWQGELFFKKITFAEDGRAACYYGEASTPYMQNWTANTLIDHHRRLAEAYQLLTIDGREYLFIEWKSGDYIYAKREPRCYVFTR